MIKNNGNEGDDGFDDSLDSLIEKYVFKEPSDFGFPEAIKLKYKNVVDFYRKTGYLYSMSNHERVLIEYVKIKPDKSIH